MAFVQLPADGVGKQVETNTPDGTNHRQVVTVGDKTTAGNTLAIDGSGRPTVNVNGTLSVKPTDGTNAISQTYDIDTSGVTHEYAIGVSLRKSASGSSVEAGTSTNPIRVDPTGTTVQPVSGTVAATQSGTWNVGTVTNVVHVDDNAGSLTVDGTVTANAGTGTFAVSAASLPLPTGAATAAKQPALGTAGTPSADVISVQGVASGTALPVSGTFWQATQPVSLASVPSHNVTNAGTFAVQATCQANNGVDIGDVTINNASGASAVNIQDGGNSITVDGTVSSNATLQKATSGGLSVYNGSVGSTAVAVKASAGQLYGYHILNTTAAVAYVQVFNVAQGSVTVGTTSPTYVLGIPASGGAVFNSDIGIAHSTAITIACTTTRSGSTGATCEVSMFYA